MRSAYVGLVVLLMTSGSVPAQDIRPPSEGGFIKSMGQPSIWKWYAGASFGAYLDGDAEDFTGYAEFGVSKDLLNPVMGALAFEPEVYGGFRADDLDGGLRALLASPLLSLGGGVDYNFKDESLHFLLRLSIPLRRGGVLGKGGDFRASWLPARGHSFNFGLTVPIGQPHRGNTRPRNMHYRLENPRPEPVPYMKAEPTLDETLANVRETAHWVNRFTIPHIDQGGSSQAKAMASFRATIETLKTHLATPSPLFPNGRTSEAEVRVYHRELDRAFSIAASGTAHRVDESTALGREVAGQAKEIILDNVIFPYNRLLGVKKKADTTREFAAHARGLFSSWMLSSKVVPEDRRDAVLHVFQTLLDIIEENREFNRKEWRDSRLVWIPLQFALLPEQYDSQAELDDILARAVGHGFTAGNHVWYVVNTEFQIELARMVERAEDYHVLWIHDIPGKNAAGDPDQVVFIQIVDVYLGTLIKRVREYDARGKLPSYMIFMDQYYYEIKKSRRWLNLLERPLDYEIDLPGEFTWMADSIAKVQAELRQAVAESELLQTRAQQYGNDWLNNQIKVHVNITYPADPSYWSNQVFPMFKWPDNSMRDHRKIAFYDITEDDPYKGMAIYSGMGIGEHYVGPTWEDRAILAQGPMLLTLKYAARQLLLKQGFKEDEIPYPLQVREKPANYDELVRAEAEKQPFATRAIELHNQTGYLFKPINVFKATLYSLLPKGSVIVIPDSLWNSFFFASALVGSCLRGGRALIIAPSLENAPGSKGFPQMSRGQDMFARLIYIQNYMADELAAAGGLLKTGLYNSPVDVRNLPGRAKFAVNGIRSTPWLKELVSFDPSVYELIDNLDELLAGFNVQYVIDDRDIRRPQLHLKVNFFASEVSWRFLSSPELSDYLRDLVVRRARTLETLSLETDVRDEAAALEEIALHTITAARGRATGEELERTAAYMMVGSANQDYRSMLMDGEVMVVITGRAGIIGLPDMLFLMGASTWVDTEEELEAVLPSYGILKWRIGRMMREAL